jgi:hypothetical protein
VIARVSEGGVQAVVFEPKGRPRWLDDLAGAVESGSFCVARTVLARASTDEIDEWLQRNLPHDPNVAHLSRQVRHDVLSLVRRVESLSGGPHVMFRIHTDAPNRRCGFHVDTVEPSAPTVGYVRVYNGAGTEYVEPQNITSMSDFYRHLSRRERIVREVARARAAGDSERIARIASELELLDESPEFLVDNDDVRIAAGGSIVAFKHLDVRLHWSDHPKGLAWVHRSPMEGARRLVVNVAACVAAAHRDGR